MKYPVGLFCIFLLAVTSIAHATSANSDTIYIKLTVNKNTSFNVNAAPLKYNKHLLSALHLTMVTARHIPAPTRCCMAAKRVRLFLMKIITIRVVTADPLLFFFIRMAVVILFPFKLGIAINGGIVYDHPANRAGLS